MKRLLVGAAVLVLAAPSYVSAAPPEGVAGAPMPTSGGEAGAGDLSRAPLASGLGAVSNRGAARFAQALGGLEPEARSTVRGAKEVEVYKAAAPAVVLVIADDGFGSGALISADGKIITNLHVVGDTEEVGVVFKPKAEGDKFGEADVRPARVIRRDEVADLALLQVSEVPEGVAPLKIGSADSVEVGSDVHAIGHPTGQAWTYTRGIVSQIRRDQSWTIEDGAPHKATIVQTQTPINPGNSGGPLLDDDLEIVGINSFISEGEGLNFAVSADDVKAFLDRASDRFIDPGLKAKAAKAQACEVTALEEWPSKKPKGTDYLLDTDCDGEGDVVATVPNEESDPIMYLSDDDGDGNIDTAIFDDERDGDFDLALFDTDGDGEFDLRGEYKPGETEPFRYERIEPEDR